MVVLLRGLIDRHQPAIQSLSCLYLRASKLLFLFFSVQLETFAQSDYHTLAVQSLEACPAAMKSLGAPPLKIHNIHLTDRDNRVDQHTAQVLWSPNKLISLFMT